MPHAPYTHAILAHPRPSQSVHRAGSVHYNSGWVHPDHGSRHAGGVSITHEGSRLEEGTRERIRPKKKQMRSRRSCREKRGRAPYAWRVRKNLPACVAHIHERPPKKSVHAISTPSIQDYFLCCRLQYSILGTSRYLSEVFATGINHIKTKSAVLLTQKHAYVKRL